MSEFLYNNSNPDGIEEEDCVTRAIMRGIGLPYNVVRNLLKLSADVNECDMLCVCCYHFLLEDIFELPIRYCYDYETVEDVALKFPHNKCIIRIDGHLTCSVGGIIEDIWDCTQEEVDCYWICQ